MLFVLEYDDMAQLAVCRAGRVIGGRVRAIRKLASVWPSEDEQKRFNTPRLASEGAVGDGGGACPAVLIPFMIPDNGYENDQGNPRII